jgi:hypothetical protein
VQKEQFGIVQRPTADIPCIWLTADRVGLIAAKRVVNMTAATLPDGSSILDMQEGAQHVAQIWLKTHRPVETTDWRHLVSRI